MAINGCVDSAHAVHYLLYEFIVVYTVEIRKGYTFMPDGNCIANERTNERTID